MGEVSHQEDPLSFPKERRAVTALVRIDLHRRGLLKTTSASDCLGIFAHPDGEAAGKLRRFLPKVFEALISLESAADACHQQDQSGEVEQLSDLVTFLSHVVDWPEDKASQRRLLKRYKTGCSVRLYLPHQDLPPTDRQEKSHGQEIEPKSYDGETPAEIDFQVLDKGTSQRMTIHFFPLRYAHYEGWSRLAGCSPEEARAVMAEKGRVEEAGRVVDQAKETMVFPQMSLRLESRNGELVSQVNGVLANHDEKDGLLFTPATMDNVHTFLPICNQNPEKRDRVLLNLARNFLKLGLKKPLPTGNSGGRR